MMQKRKKTCKCVLMFPCDEDMYVLQRERIEQIIE